MLGVEGAEYGSPLIDGRSRLVRFPWHRKVPELGLGKFCLFLSSLPIHLSFFMFCFVGGDDDGSGDEKVEQPLFLQETIHSYEFSSST